MDLTRRRFLAILGAAVAAAVAACSPGGGTASPLASPSPRPTPPPPTPSPTPTPVSTATPVPTNGVALRQKIGRMLIVGFRGTAPAADDPFRVAIAAGELGGVILFDHDQLTNTAGRNISSPSQLARLTALLRSDALPGPTGARLLISVDQEGGYVARLNPSDGYPTTESEAALGAANDLAHTTAAASAVAGTLVAAGIDLNFAPVVDLDVNPANPAIGALKRSFSADPAVVVAQATRVIQAHHDAGVRCAIKHFPGEGSATGNTDNGIVDVTTTWTEKELTPFGDLVAAGLPDVVMVGHIVNGQLDPHHPASLSPATVGGILRDHLGWTGPVVSDDMQAPAITRAYGTSEAIALAIEAGVDLLLFANQQVYDPNLVSNVIAIVEQLVASGRISEARLDESVARIEGLFKTVE